MNLQAKPETGASRGPWRKSEYIFLALVLLAALLFRGIYLSQVREGVIFNSYRLPHLDMHFFHGWAEEIKGGDLLGDRSCHPYHDWHRRAGTLVEWNGWYGGERFHQSPLYPYLLACLYRLGFSVGGVKVLQALLGLCSIVLIYRIAREVFSPLAAAFASLLALFYGPFYLYESQLLRASWIVFLGLLSIILLLKAGRTGFAWWWAVSGAAAGLLFLLKAGFILWPAAALLWLRLGKGRGGRKARSTLVFLLAFLVVFSPLFLRNLLVGAPWHSSTSVGAVTFTFGNAADVTGDGFQVSRFTRRIMEVSGGEFWPTVRETIATHRGGWSALAALWLGKFAAFWRGYETPGNANYYYARLHSPFLKYCTFTFSVVGPLALLGIFLSLRRWKKSLLLYLYLAVNLAAVVAFYFISRFRLPAVPVLIVFAGFALERIVAWLKEGKRVQALLLILAGLLLYLCLSPPGGGGPTEIAPDDFLAVAAIYARQGDRAVALHELELAEKHYPELRDRIGEMGKNLGSPTLIR